MKTEALKAALDAEWNHAIEEAIKKARHFVRGRHDQVVLVTQLQQMKRKVKE